MKTDIIFDLDGTIIDPVEGITNAAKFALEQLGITDVSQDSLNAFIGPPLMETFTQQFHLSREDAICAIMHFKEHFKEHGLHQNTLFPGIAHMLATLQLSGKRLYIATTKPVDFAEIILDDFGIVPYFTFICGSPPEDIGLPKDEVLSLLFSLTDVDAQNAVMVGDRRHDVSGAHAHNVPCIGVAYGYGGEKELQSAGADHIVHTVSELQDLLLTL